MTKRRNLVVVALTILLIATAALWYFYIYNANKSELDERWAGHNPSSQIVVDHSTWQVLLDDYLVTDTDSEVNLFDYAGLLDDDRQPLDDYVEVLSQYDPSELNRLEQKAYWINLYNAVTVRLILDNYPLVSITNLGTSLTEFGPWNDIAVSVNGIDLSLNDIEHRIIRPLYDDYRIHFAVNCASIGCPNLAATAFNATSLDQQLDDAAAEYLTHPRGLEISGPDLNLSTLFKWYEQDFGNSQSEVLATLGKHTSNETRQALERFAGSPSYEYDWSLNGYCSVDDECGEL